MTSPISTILVGFGFSGRTFHAPLIAAEPGLRLVAIGSTRPDDVAGAWPEARIVADPRAAVTDSRADLVVIATPNETHAPLARLAIEAGKHVVVDKPFTLTLAEAEALAELADSRRVTLSVFHNRRWDSDFLTIRAAIDARELGTVMQVESRFDRWRPEVRDRWREGDGLGSGILYDLGPHLVDQMLVLFGPPDSVAAWIACQRPGARADDAFEIVLRWGERVARLSAGMLVGGGTNRWLVHGTRGTLVKRHLDIQEDQLRAGMVPGALGWGDDPDQALFVAGGEQRPFAPVAGDQRRFYASLAGCLADGAANPVPPEQACAVMRVLDAARANARH